MNYSEMVNALVKPSGEILKDLTPKRVYLLHMALGIAGEAGEVVDLIKKHAMNNKSLNIKDIIEELGDLEFYLEGFRQAAEITRGECLEDNMAKLGVRYSGFKYSDQKASARADKNNS